MHFRHSIAIFTHIFGEFIVSKSDQFYVCDTALAGDIGANISQPRLFCDGFLYIRKQILAPLRNRGDNPGTRVTAKSLLVRTTFFATPITMQF
jgi:hypothetical protein